MSRLLYPIVLISLFAQTLLSACSVESPLAATPWPTEHLPTVIAMTAAAIPSSTSAATLQATEVPVSSTEVPTAASIVPLESPTDIVLEQPTAQTPEPLPSPDPLAAALQIIIPGPMSKVISPLRMRSYVVPGADGLVTVELFGEDGRLLARQISRVFPPESRRSYITLEVPFEIRAAAETARIQVSTYDQFGRLTAVSSIHVILLSSGEEDITPPGYLQERLLLTAPPPLADLQGGEVLITGSIYPVNDNPLIVELVRFTGEVVGSRMVTYQKAPGEFQPFSAEIPYSITAQTWVRMTIRQADPRIPGTAYLYSREIFLKP